MASDDIQDRIREAVQGHFYILTQAFADVDFAGIGAVTKDDFKTILTKNVMRPTDEQVIVFCTYVYHACHFLVQS